MRRSIRMLSVIIANEYKIIKKEKIYQFKRTYKIDSKREENYLLSTIPLLFDLLT
jgi:hypothetical protein